MKKSRHYFAVLIDEYGGMSGIITLHDLMEALVGDLYEEEDDLQRPEILKTDENTWNILGSASLDDVAKALDIKLPVERYDTYNAMSVILSDAYPLPVKTLPVKQTDL